MTRGLWVAVVVQLPAELPWNAWPGSGLVVTPLEISIGLLWLSHLAGRWSAGWRPQSPARFAWWDPAVWWFAFIACCVLAGVLAPSERAHALKSAVRVAGVASLFWVAGDLHGDTAAVQRTARWLTGMAVGLVGVGLLEGAFDPTWLTTFRTGPTLAGGAWRLTATTPHANQTAAILAMVLPIAGALALRDGAGRASWVATLVIGLGLTLTLSRAGLFAGVAGLGAVAWLRGRHRAPAALRVVGGTLLTVALAAAVYEPAAMRLGGQAEGRYRARYHVPPTLSTASSQTATVWVTLENAGDVTWSPGRVRLAYHLLDASGGLLTFEGRRSPLPAATAPGEVVQIPAAVVAPEQPGRYLVAWDMVHEDVTWFGEGGDAVAITRLNVSAAPAAGALGAVRAALPDSTAGPRRLPRWELWQIAGDGWQKRPILGWGLDTFRLQWGPWAGIEGVDRRLHVNNLYLGLLVSVGLLGLTCWLLLMWALVGRPLRVIAGDGLSAGFAGALVTFALHGVLDDFMAFYGVMGVLWIAAGVVWARTSRP